MIVTLAGTSGAGKSTVGEWLRKRFGNILKPVVSITTREPKNSDPPGEYAYVSVEEFQRMKSAGEFIWDVCPHGTDYYGTLFRFSRRNQTRTGYNFSDDTGTGQCRNASHPRREDGFENCSILYRFSFFRGSSLAIGEQGETRKRKEDGEDESRRRTGTGDLVMA